MLRLDSMIHAVMSTLPLMLSFREEVIRMQNRSMLVLEDGSCPFLGGEYYSCCFSSLMMFR